VATIAIKLLPMAIWIGRCRAKVSIGTIKIPPPTPSVEPRRPATNPMLPSIQRFTSTKVILLGMVALIVTIGQLSLLS